MVIIDVVNAAFILVLGYTRWHNCYALFKDKQVRGTRLWVVAFGVVCGSWHLYYYLQLNQTVSLLANSTSLVANVLWVTMAVTYNRRGARG